MEAAAEEEAEWAQAEAAPVWRRSGAGEGLPRNRGQSPPQGPRPFQRTRLFSSFSSSWPQNQPFLKDIEERRPEGPRLMTAPPARGPPRPCSGGGRRRPAPGPGIFHIRGHMPAHIARGISPWGYPAGQSREEIPLGHLIGVTTSAAIPQGTCQRGIPWGQYPSALQPWLQGAGPGAFSRRALWVPLRP